MIKIRTVSDLDECARLWKRVFHHDSLFCLWELRNCFQTEFNRRPHFVVAEEYGRLLGLLPLAWVSESQEYAFFPGETWQQKTWLERNRIWAVDEVVAHAMFATLDAPFMLRYLERDSVPSQFAGIEPDETRYLFDPSDYVYSFELYQTRFSAKSLRKINREIEALSAPGVVLRYNDPGDVSLLLEMNLASFGEHSYFHDARFLGAFERVVAWLRDRNAVLTTTVLIGGRAAAVDLGVVWDGTYILLAGGTDRTFPGVAKLINFHHLRYSCQQRFREVDFLCGDFGWKERFRLTPRTLFKIAGPAVIQHPEENCTVVGASR